MKKNLLLAISCLLSLNANALIVSVNGHGEIDEKGMEITINETEEDPLTGKELMQLEGKLLCSGQLTVAINRSSAGIEDEFCCASQCTAGNSETSETLHFSPTGIASWFVHYTPAPNSRETVIYTFTDSEQSLVLTVHYNNDAEGIEDVKSQKSDVRKVMRDGIVYIEYNNHTYHL